MKINDAFVLRKIYGTFLLVPVIKNDISDDIVSFNSTGGLILETAEVVKDADELLCKTNKELNKNNSEEIRNQLKDFINNLIDLKYIVEE